jgi:LacI family transcriptional regulator/LacI family repressor for deo operon, udp, cdd, tsx, nupC, and nupG
VGRPTINDVAREAGVSKATVSAALNGKASVSEVTRQKVRETAEKLNYRPQASARHLGSRAEPVLGVIVKEIANPFYSELVTGASELARERGYLLIVGNSGGDLQEEVRLVQAFRRRGINGVIISPSSAEDVDYSHLFELKRDSYPFVLLETIRGIQAALVDIDNMAGAKEAAMHLIQLGHTRICHFGGPAYSTHSLERIEGVRRAFSESRLVFTEEVVIPAGADPEAGYSAAKAYFGPRLEALPREEVLPVGITCFNDLVALGVWAALDELGVGVPHEASIVGYDDIDLIPYLPKRLTSIRSFNVEMGRKAAELLVDQIEAGSASAPRRITLPTELVVRASTAPVEALPVAVAEARAGGPAPPDLTVTFGADGEATSGSDGKSSVEGPA